MSQSPVKKQQQQQQQQQQKRNSSGQASFKLCFYEKFLQVVESDLSCNSLIHVKVGIAEKILVFY